jgi:hypothetical protein
VSGGIRVNQGHVRRRAAPDKIKGIKRVRLVERFNESDPLDLAWGAATDVAPVRGCVALDPPAAVLRASARLRVLRVKLRRRDA